MFTGNTKNERKEAISPLGMRIQMDMKNLSIEVKV